MKKTLAMFLASTVILTCLSGCGNDSSEKKTVSAGEYGDTGGLELPLDTKNTKITMLAVTSNSGLNDSLVINELRKRTGIDLELVETPSSTIKEKAKVLLSAKQFPDIFGSHGLDWQTINDLATQGAFEEVTQYMDELPNLKNIFFDNAEEYDTKGMLASMYNSDGGLYFFPRYDNNRDVNHGMLYRKDIFDKHGLKTWTNDEEFYQTLKKLKELYPSSQPFVTKNGINILNQIAEFNGMRWPSEYYDEEAKSWKYGGTDEKFKEILDFVKKLYDEKLLDPEFATCTQAAWTSKMTQRDKAFVTIDWIGRLDMFKEQAQGTVPEYDLRYAAPIGGGKVVSLEKITSGPSIKKSGNSLLAMKLCDYLLSPSGAELMTMGIEGESYHLGADGKADYIGFEGEIPAITDLEPKYGLYISGTYMRTDRRSAYYKFTEKEQEAQDIMMNKEGGGFWPIDPKLSLTKEETEELNKILVDLKPKAEEFAMKYIMSDESGDAAWQAWIETAKKTGVEKAIEILNQAQKRYDAKF